MMQPQIPINLEINDFINMQVWKSPICDKSNGKIKMCNNNHKLDNV